MKRLIFMLFLLSFGTAHAATPGGIPMIAVGATASNPLGGATIPFSSPGASGSDQTFTLYVAPATKTTNNHYPFKRDGAIYRVPTTSNVKTVCFSGTGWADIINAKYQYISATSTFADNTATGSLVGPIYQGFAANVYLETTGPTANTTVPQPGMYTFANSSYPGIQISIDNSYMVTLECYEKVTP